MRFSTLIAIFLLGPFCFVNAADWPCWRGKDGLGVSPEKSLPTRWSQTDNIAWSTAIPGRGACSPIVVGERVYLTTQTEDTGLHVLALDRKTGQILWDKSIGQGKLRSNKLHNMATPTPVSDGNRIWVLFGTGDLACLDHAGEVVWQRNLVKEYGEYKTNHGYGTSPMLVDGKLFIACMHQGPSYVLAVDAGTGENVWKKDRNLEPKDEAQDSYSSPIVVLEGGRPQLLLAGAEHVNAYNPATGDEIWTAGGMKVSHPYGRTIAGLTAADGIVVAVASGFQNRGFTIGLKTGGHGDVTDTHRLWTSQKYSSDCPTPVIEGNNVFSIRDDGMASCLDLKTGEPHWQERLFSANVKVSPVAGDGKVYFMNGQGNCTVVKASPKLEILATNSLNETTLSTPAISGGKLFLKTEEKLYCVK
ncbi:MAG TPA: PQQ-binding-like beta-propeller repeat protein [Verrucomicrobiae bacterium]|nr:PQQ-binding-like beta-propeller repeat protein [Verrucomicrobiae bacterium]